MLGGPDVQAATPLEQDALLQTELLFEFFDVLVGKGRGRDDLPDELGVLGPVVEDHVLLVVGQAPGHERHA